MADRAVILSTRPAAIIQDISIPLPRWRDKKSPEFLAYVDQIYSFMGRTAICCRIRTARWWRPIPYPRASITRE